MSSESADQLGQVTDTRPPARPGRTRVVRRPPGWGATIGAVTFYCISLTPALLPRPWWLQATVAAITATIGYAVGVVIGWAVRAFGLRVSPRTMPADAHASRRARNRRMQNGAGDFSRELGLRWR